MHGSKDRTTLPASMGWFGSPMGVPSSAFSTGPATPLSSRGEQFQVVGHDALVAADLVVVDHQPVAQRPARSLGQAEAAAASWASRNPGPAARRSPLHPATAGSVGDPGRLQCAGQVPAREPSSSSPAERLQGLQSLRPPPCAATSCWASDSRPCSRASGPTSMGSPP